MSRLYLVVGGLIVVALFAALIVPWFVNWDDYKTSFEVEAGKILGHPVRVIGSANASILPSPSLTFTEVQVGDEDGRPIMTVDRFAVTIELMPLLQGEFRVVSMRLERPIVRIAVGAGGAIDWLMRSEASESLDPEKVVLEDVQISDGSLEYVDTRTGVSLGFNDINALVDARALSGPWRAEGSYLDGGVRVPFHFATGRVLEDGTIRVKSDFSPAHMAVSVSADGVVGRRPDAGLVYDGTYTVTQILTPSGEQAEASAEEFGGWRSEGSFVLTGDRLSIDRAILSNGPPDRPSSLAGTLTVDFGDSPRFDASAEARQLDLDRAFGNGPTEPIDVSLAAEHLVDWLAGLPVPAIPGRVAFNVPGIIIGGSVIQDVALVAEPVADGWRLDAFSARLPGQALLDATGVLTIAGEIGFNGDARLAVAQPATFAAWWRGRSEAGAGRLLAAFDLSGKADIAARRIVVNDVNARIGDSTIAGRFEWRESAAERYRSLGTDLKADRLDFVQVRALAELLVGRNLADNAVLADDYSILLTAGTFDYEDLRLRDVTVNAAYANDALTVVQFAVGDVGGADFEVTSGRIDDLTTNPRGHLDARLNATRLDGVTRIVERFLPGSGLARWLATAAPALAPASLSARITAPPRQGASGLLIDLEGQAGATSIDLAAESGKPSAWRDNTAIVTLVLDSTDTAGLVRQIGLGAIALDDDPGAHVEVRASGMPGAGLDATVAADVSGLTADVAGMLTVAADRAPSFAGTFEVSSANLDRLIAMAGLGIPGAAVGTTVQVAGTLATGDDGASLAWRRGVVGGRVVGGAVDVSRRGADDWRIGGDLTIDDADLGWLASLGLGFAPLPTGEAAAPWSKTPFISPVFGPVTGRVNVAADTLAVGDALALTSARFTVALQPQRIDVELAAGAIAGGSVTGGLSIHNVGGNANMIGRFDLRQAALERFVWQLDGRAVATGVLDLSANFEATGRSPAGLVSSATGGGAIAVTDGQARYVSPDAGRLLVRATDLGQQYSEDALGQAFADLIDAGPLVFGEANAAFAIAAGAVRMSNLTLRAGGAEARGAAVLDLNTAVVDLNTMRLDSDWSLTFDPGDRRVEASDPEVGIVFRGPIEGPVRSIDVLPLAAYLNARQEVRMLEILAMEAATRAEKERLTRLTRKLREDATRREEEARLAAEAEARRREAARAAAAALEAFHVEREIVAVQRFVASMKTSAERAAAASAAAEAIAAEALDAAMAARTAADAAAAALSRALTAEEDALSQADAADAALAESSAAASAAAEEAAAAVAAADVAEARGVEAAAIEAEARAAAAERAGEADEAGAALDAAHARTATADATAATAEDDAAAAALALDAAREEASGAAAAADAAAAALAEAETALAVAQAEADTATEADATAAALAATVEAERLQADANAAEAADSATAAEIERDRARSQAERLANEAEAAAASAAASARTAQEFAVFADSVAAGPGADQQAVNIANAARATAEAAAAQAESRRAAAEAAAVAAATARSDHDAATLRASQAAEAAAAAAAVAAGVRDGATVAADRAAAAMATNAAALEVLDARTKARDELAARLVAQQALAAQTAAAMDEAEAAAATADDARDTARASAAKAASELATIEDAATDRSAAAAAALAAAEAAVAALAAERAAADEARATAAAAAARASAAADLLAERSLASEAARAAYETAEANRADAGQASDEAEVAATEAAEAAAVAEREAEGRASAAAAAREAARQAEVNGLDAAALGVAEPTDQAALEPVGVVGDQATPATESAVDVPTPRLRRERPLPASDAADAPLVIVPAQ